MMRVEGSATITFSTTFEPTLTGCEVGPLLPPPAACGGFAAELAAFVIQRAHAQRKEAKACQAAEESAARVAEEHMIATMHAKADSMRAHAHTAGWLAIVGGSVSVTGSVMASQISVTPEGTRDVSKTYVAASTGLKEGGGLVAKGGDWAKGLGDASGALRDAKVEGDRATSRRAQQAADNARKDAQEARELVQRVMSMLKELSRAQDETMLAAARRV